MRARLCLDRLAAAAKCVGSFGYLASFVAMVMFGRMVFGCSLLLNGCFDFLRPWRSVAAAVSAVVAVLGDGAGLAGLCVLLHPVLVAMVMFGRMVFGCSLLLNGCFDFLTFCCCCLSTKIERKRSLGGLCSGLRLGLVL